MAELKPCPFCRCVPEIKQFGAIFRLTADHKKDCFFRQQNGDNPGRMSALNRWSIELAWNGRE